MAKKTNCAEDYLGLAGAENLRRWLQEFWHRHPAVVFRVEEIVLGLARGSIFVVRSNLVDGKPPAS